MSLNIKNHHKAVASVTGNPFAIDFSRCVNVGGCSRTSAGVYVVAFDEPVAVDDIALIGLNGATALFGTIVLSASIATVRLFDAAGAAAEGNFWIAVVNGL